MDFGLIEARTLARACTQHPSIPSGAVAPRPHCARLPYLLGSNVRNTQDSGLRALNLDVTLRFPRSARRLAGSGRRIAFSRDRDVRGHSTNGTTRQGTLSGQHQAGGPSSSCCGHPRYLPSRISGCHQCGKRLLVPLAGLGLLTLGVSRLASRGAVQWAQTISNARLKIGRKHDHGR